MRLIEDLIEFSKIFLAPRDSAKAKTRRPSALFKSDAIRSGQGFVKRFTLLMWSYTVKRFNFLPRFPERALDSHRCKTSDHTSPLPSSFSTCRASSWSHCLSSRLATAKVLPFFWYSLTAIETSFFEHHLPSLRLFFPNNNLAQLGFSWSFVWNTNEWAWNYGQEIRGLNERAKIT